MLTSSDDTNSSAPAFTGLSLIFMSINGKDPTTIGEVLNILEPVFTAQHFHLRLVFQLLIVSFFKYSQYSSKNIG